MYLTNSFLVLKYSVVFCRSKKLEVIKILLAVIKWSDKNLLIWIKLISGIEILFKEPCSTSHLWLRMPNDQLFVTNIVVNPETCPRFNSKSNQLRYRFHCVSKSVVLLLHLHDSTALNNTKKTLQKCLSFSCKSFLTSAWKHFPCQFS